MGIEIRNRLRLIVDQEFKGKPQKLADKIEISVHTLSGYLNPNKPNKVGIDALIGLYERLNINIHWVLTGKGEMYLNEEQQKKDFDIDDVLVHLTEEQRQEIMTRTQEMRLMNTLKQRVDGLENHIEDLEKRLDIKE